MKPVDQVLKDAGVTAKYKTMGGWPLFSRVDNFINIT